MSFAIVAVAGMAALGAAAGSMKSGPDSNNYGRGTSGDALEAYKNLVAKGPGAADVTAAYDAKKNYNTILADKASNGLYDSAAGNRLADQQFAGARQSLAQSLQDQMAIANRSASAAGRSTNDPILRARLGAEAMRAKAGLAAQQGSAAMELGRQNTLDSLNMGSQRVNLLQGMADQAFQGQRNIFDMGSQIQQMDMASAQYEQSRGGGLKGLLTGAVTGAGAGMQMVSGFGGMGGGGGGMPGGMADSSSFTMPQMGSQFGRAPAAMGTGWSGGMSAAPQFPSNPFGGSSSAYNPAYFNQANFAGATSFGPQNAPPRMGMTSAFGPNSFQYK